WCKKLLLYALPVCLGAIVVPVLNIVDTFTVPRLLLSRGLAENEAMAAFGVYSRGLPLVQLVAMIFSSISVALVPAIAEAKLQGRHEWIRSRTELSIRISWYIGWAATFGLALTALPINIMLFKNGLGTDTMMLLAFSIVFSV